MNCIIILLSQLLLIALGLGQVIVSLGATESINTLSESTSYVTKECEHKLLQVNSLAKFDTFMRHYSIVINQTERPKRGILNTERNLRKCFDQKEQLNELKALIDRRHEGVCRMTFVSQLIDFHLKYFVKSNESSHQEVSSQSNGNFASHIFSLVAHQVAFNCKSKLGPRLEVAQREANCHEVVASFLPPDSNSIEETKSIGGDQEFDSISSFLNNFKRVEDLALISRNRKHTRSLVEPYFDVIVSNEVLSRLNELKRRCRQREPFYMAIFEPIVALSQIGYDVGNITEQEARDQVSEKLLKCWLATAQLCQGILRTHISAKDGVDSDKSVDEVNEKKLVEIKFGQLPGSEEETEVQAEDENKLELEKDDFDEISIKVVELVAKRSSFRDKLKRRMVNWARKFVEKHVDVDAMRDEGARKFMEALTKDEEGAGDSSVAFSGKKRNPGLFLPGRLITDDADTIVQGTGFFVHKSIALLFSSVVAICLSAVFLWFTLYAIVSSMKKSTLSDGDQMNFKENWRQMRDQRMKVIDDKVKRKGWKDKMMVYRSPTG